MSLSIPAKNEKVRAVVKCAWNTPEATLTCRTAVAKSARFDGGETVLGGGKTLCAGQERRAGRAFGFVAIHLPGKGKEVARRTFRSHLDKGKLKKAELRNGHFLLRLNPVCEDPSMLWEPYIQLTQIEAAFKILKSELELRPICHIGEKLLEARIFVAFAASAPLDAAAAASTANQTNGEGCGSNR